VVAERMVKGGSDVSPILSAQIASGRATLALDFTGAATQVNSPLNAPSAVSGAIANAGSTDDAAFRDDLLTFLIADPVWSEDVSKQLESTLSALASGATPRTVMRATALLRNSNFIERLPAASIEAASGAVAENCAVVGMTGELATAASEVVALHGDAEAQRKMAEVLIDWMSNPRSPLSEVLSASAMLGLVTPSLQDRMLAAAEAQFALGRGSTTDFPAADRLLRASTRRRSTKVYRALLRRVRDK